MAERTGRTRAGRVQRARSGRRAGDSGTREAILEAARARFAEHGYDGATIRGIAADAGVDPALVHHFHGSKERLFTAAMRLPVVPSEVLTSAFAEAARRGDLASPGEQLVRTALSVWERPEVLSIFTGLLRSALTSEAAASMFREFITEAILGPVRAMIRARHPEAGPADAAYRAAAVASQMVGLALTRYVLRLAPIAEASAAELAATVGPTLDRYLAGDIRAASGRRADGGQSVG
ncbi:MAG TPA: TetR family transcriptional regulator [Streptosporangiaceae bacterium]|nr:TetR family transcriptional regulator [Streptosporangiaceae bacterium]